MQAPGKRERLPCLLTALQEAMGELGYWSPVQPSALALASNQPFACDTLSFEQWLQFVFIPRLRALVESDATLPFGSAVTTMAEVSLPCKKQGHQKLLKVLRDIDSLLNSG